MKKSDDNLISPIKSFKGFKKLKQVSAVKKILLPQSAYNRQLKDLTELLESLPAGAVDEIWVCGTFEAYQYSEFFEQHKCKAIEIEQRQKHNVFIVQKEE